MVDHGGQPLGQFSRDYVLLEGVRLAIDRSGVLGQPGAYRRYIVACPSPAHRGRLPCKRTRTFSRTDSTDAERLGQLGVWLANRDNFADRASHMAYIPSKDEIAAYMQNMR